MIGGSRTTHGEGDHGRGYDHRTPEYRSWTAMVQRCTNTKHAAYDSYGGRGIRVCDGWRDYAVFLRDMGRRPSPSHTLDRIDVSGNYEPDNCRWATKALQSRNRRGGSNTGFRGVSFDKATRRFVASLKPSPAEKNIRLGKFATLEPAVAARLAAEERYFCGVETTGGTQCAT